ncbi:MAG: hypothetical protein EAZ89_16535 [Bacteroidetes bacterium]|nr:MAG: hypothetical protein EAZ89_16535 [Bacteroidota bacterium]
MDQQASVITKEQLSTEEYQRLYSQGLSPTGIAGIYRLRILVSPDHEPHSTSWKSRRLFYSKITQMFISCTPGTEGLRFLGILPTEGSALPGSPLQIEAPQDKPLVEFEHLLGKLRLSGLARFSIGRKKQRDLLAGFVDEQATWIFNRAYLKQHIEFSLLLYCSLPAVPVQELCVICRTEARSGGRMIRKRTARIRLE